jgi:hypothetical protein
MHIENVKTLPMSRSEAVVIPNNPKVDYGAKPYFLAVHS